jgi:hypothetical protein
MSILGAWLLEWLTITITGSTCTVAFGGGAGERAATLDDRDGLQGRRCADPTRKPILRKDLTYDAKVQG